MNLPRITLDTSNQTLVIQGDWLITTLNNQIEQQLANLSTIKIINCEKLTALDSAGSLLLLELQSRFPEAQLQLSPQYQSTLLLVQKFEKSKPALTAPAKTHASFLMVWGMLATRFFHEFIVYLSFVGEIFYFMSKWFLRPSRILWRNIANTIENTGFYALPIIALLSFLVGIVLAYQVGVQLQSYGANIFVVNLLGISILREFAALMTAIIIAGRTGSAFAAELGTMEINREVDALATIGVNPVEYLVLGKVIGLMISLPLLTMWASFLALAGGMIMSKLMLGITFTSFWHQFHQAVAIKHLWIGLMKTPFFAFIIASIGCFQGLTVSGGAESVGKQTTRSVVQALFLIIVADAFFSILLSWFHA